MKGLHIHIVAASPLAGLRRACNTLRVPVINRASLHKIYIMILPITSAGVH